MRAWRRGDRVFYLLMAVALAAVVFAGFAPTFYLRPAVRGPLRPLLVAHGVLFSSWMLLLIVQSALITARRVRLHQLLGYAGAAVAAVMVVVGTSVALGAARRDVNPGSLEFLIVPLTDMVVFGTLVGAAVQLRRRAEAHKRLMLLATIALLPAAVGRLAIDLIQRGGAFENFAVVDLFLAAALLYDLVTRRRVHPALLFGGAFLVASQWLRVVIGATDRWQVVARWLIT